VPILWDVVGDVIEVLNNTGSELHIMADLNNENYIDKIKEMKRRKQLHPFVEERLKYLLSKIYPQI
jgi:hypothetical protein